MKPAFPSLRPSRRRVLQITAAAATSTVIGGVASALAAAPASVSQKRFAALGSFAEIRLVTEQGGDAERVLHRLQREIARLEAIFSIYDAGSAVSHLNRKGKLSAPPLELIELLSLCQRIHQASDGLFDPSVQPLWEFHARSQSGLAIADAPVNELELADILGKVGFPQVRFSASEVRFARPEMKLTFNGIAQGYVTDRITRLLKDEGFHNVLVNIGEISALGTPDATDSGWPVTLRPARTATAMDHRLVLKNRAVATSELTGTTFDEAEILSHILDPRSGKPVASDTLGVSVIATTAALADGLSTVAVVSGADRFKKIIKSFPGTAARLAKTDGSIVWFEA